MKKLKTYKNVVAYPIEGTSYRYPQRIIFESSGEECVFVRVLPKDTHRNQVWFEYRYDIEAKTYNSKGQEMPPQKLGKKLLLTEGDLKKMQPHRIGAMYIKLVYDDPS